VAVEVCLGFSCWRLLLLEIVCRASRLVAQSRVYPRALWSSLNHLFLFFLLFSFLASSTLQVRRLYLYRSSQVSLNECMSL